MKGRKPTPTAIKKLNGNPGKRALNKAEPQYADLGLAPPEFLDEIAQKEWRRLIRLMLQAYYLRTCAAVGKVWGVGPWKKAK